MLILSIGRLKPLFLAVILTLLAVGQITWAKNDRPLIIGVQIAGESASDDFIKIYNPSDSDIFLGNYQGSYLRLVKRTKSSAKDYSIKSWSKDATAKIPAKGYFLWASSKNPDFPNLIKADSQTSQTISKDNGIALRLGAENTGEMIDAVGWGDFNNVLFETASFNPNPEANQTLNRKNNNGIFQDADNNQNDFALISPNLAENEIIQTEKIPAVENIVPTGNTPGPTETPENTTQTNQPIQETKQYPRGIIFNEILPSPEGSDETEEWIEIFNKNDFAVDLAGWQIKDTAGKIKNYTFPENSAINAKQYLVLKRPETKITLNNDSDGLELIKPDNNIADKISFEKSATGASYNLTDSDWQWSSVLTPGSENIIQNPESDKNQQNMADKFDISPKEAQASIGQTIKNGKKIPFFLIFTGLLLAIVSASGILFLKKKILKQT